MGDPHAVVFHLPEESGEDSSLTSGVTETTTNAELSAPDNLVKQIMLQMRGYLVDNNVQIIELTSKTLKVFVSLVFLIRASIMFSVHEVLMRCYDDPDLQRHASINYKELRVHAGVVVN